MNKINKMQKLTKKSKAISKAERDLEIEFSRRTVLAAGAGGVVWAGLIARLFQLQVLEGDRFESLAAENRVRLELAPPERGRILDRFGVPLASHRRAGRVTLVREQVGDMKETLAQIANLIDLPAERQERILSKAYGQPGFVPTIVAAELTYEDFARMNVHAVDLPGIQVEMAATRSYPRGRDFAHVLGYVARASEKDLTRLTKDTSVSQAEQLRRLFKHPDMRTGREGIERVSEDWLRGTVGQRRVVTNAAGRIIKELPSDDLAPTPGKNLSITIDADLQRTAIDRFGDESGAAAVIDIETGDILALVSTPAYDPNDFVNGISTADYRALQQNDRSPLYHKAYDGLYPPGSTFKMVTATAALEAGISPTKTVYCPGHYRFGNRTWHCWKRGGHGTVNMHSAIKGSCDTYFYEIARLTGVEKLAEVSKRFGFGHRWEIGLWGGQSGVVPNDEWKRARRGEKWYEGETLNYGIGQGYLNASPLQLAVMCARIASEGREITPNLIGEGPRPQVRNPIQAANLDADMMRRMKAGMFGVTSEAGGTARSSGALGVDGIRLAGKTGTAQVRRITTAERRSGILKGENIDRKLRDHALFVAYAPHDDPKYAIGVVVEHGEGGSRTAAPVARDILAHAVRTDSRRAAKYQRTAAAPSPAGASSKGAPQ